MQTTTYRRTPLLIVIGVIVIVMGVIGVIIGQYGLLGIAAAVLVGGFLFFGEAIKIGNDSITENTWPKSVVLQAEAGTCKFHRISNAGARGKISLNTFVITNQAGDKNVFIHRGGFTKAKRKLLFSQLYQWLKNSPCTIDPETETSIQRLSQ